MSSCDSSVWQTKSCKFDWTFPKRWWSENYSEVFPESIANEDFPQMKSRIKGSSNNSGMYSIGIMPTTEVPFYAKFDVYLFSYQTKEKVKIIETRKFFSDKSGKELGSYKFPTETVVLVFDVSLVFASKHNKDELSAVKPVQDIPNNLINDMERLYVSKECHDVTVTVNDREFKAHKAVLIARSPVFAAMFQQEHQMISINLTDTAADVFEELLRYIYTDTVRNLDETAEDLLAASIKYEMPNLKLKCEDHLFANISIEKAIPILILADKNKANQLKTKVLNYIVNNACAVLKMDEWKDLAKTNVQLMAEAFHAQALKKAA